jgi:putative PEP-CTERM system histidine kinase
LILLFSGPLRARLRVFINKHFFHYKYDYREEWLRFIRTLSSNETDIPLPERAIRAIAQMIDSPGGVLWMRREDGHYEPVAKWNMEPPLSANEPAGSSLIRFLEIQKWVINLDEYRRDPGLYQSLGDLVMPSWLRTLPDAWLIAPLILQEKLHGFVVLARSPAVSRHFNWEDCDLLKTTGTQAASHLAQHAASQALAEARQFEAFNRLSTYVVHDLKNLISQLSLVVSNGARHRQQPAVHGERHQHRGKFGFKMNRLLVRMRDGVQADSKRMVNLAKLLAEVVTAAQASKPARVLECHTRTWRSRPTAIAWHR